MKSLLLSLALLLHLSGHTLETTPSKVRVLYNSLDPSSISQHLAFYQLYPQSPEGLKALKQAWSLLSGSQQTLEEKIPQLPYFSSVVNSIVSLINKSSQEETDSLTSSELAFISKIATRLPNRQLKGFMATSEQEVLELPPDQIDLARGLLLATLEENDNYLIKMQSYEASIDLMALQILARLPKNATPEKKIEVINQLIFEELGFRFPPHSLYAKDIDIYTFLPSVLDSRHGVCLGVSILYLCIAQRLDLPLETITPPGHIYIRYRDGNKIINIETTARGINIDSENYLSVDTRSLQERTIKEVIGLAHMNQAATYWEQENYSKALESYLKAKPYLPEDKFIDELMGYNYLFVGNKEEGEKLLLSIKNYLPDHAVSKDTMIDDYFAGNVDAEAMKVIFKRVDKTRESVVEKQKALQVVLRKHPKFGTGLSSLATTWLQLHRQKEALEVLEEYSDLAPEDPTGAYYLSILYAERLDYEKSWEYLRKVENIVQKRNHHPKVLKELRKELSILSPE